MSVRLTSSSTGRIGLTFPCILCSWFAFAGLQAQDRANKPAEPTGLRRYDQGPLTPDDFHSDVATDRSGNESDLAAYVRTEIRYQVRFRSHRQEDQTIAELERIDLFAVVLPDHSWMAQKQNPQLLDHLQGHFDIMHAAALRASLMFSELLESDHRPAGKGPTENDAVGDLQQKIKQLITPWVERANEEKSAYGRITAYGRLIDQQDQLRKKQTETIQALTQKVKQNIRD